MSINAEIYVGLTAVIFLFTLARHDHSITRTNIFTHKWIDIFLLFNSFLFPDSGKFTHSMNIIEHITTIEIENMPSSS